MMKKAILTLLLLCPLYSTVYAAHGQLISKQTCYFTKKIPTAIELQPVADTLCDMAWDKNKNVLSIQEDGVYEFITIIQYGIKDTAKLSGNLHYWLEVNGKALLETVQVVSVPLQTKTNLIRFDSAVPLEEGSQIRFMFSSTSPFIGLLSFASMKSSPSVASVSLSVFKIGNIVTYY